MATVDISRFDWYTESKAVGQVIVNLSVIPRLHKEGYFVGVTRRGDPTTAKEVALLMMKQSLAMEEAREKFVYGLFSPST